MPSVAFLVPVRNKEKNLTRLVESVFAQDYAAPMEILLSDQGSEDGSRGVLANLARKYNGPHKVRVLDCPVLELRGMAGLNAHFDWLHTQTDASHIVFACADDYVSSAQRVTKVMKAFEEKDPSMVMHMMYFTDDKLEYQGESITSGEGSRWVKPKDVYGTQIGGSTAHSWTHEFYEKAGGLSGPGGEDMVLPMLAAIDKGAWLIDEPLYTYIRYADEENTGLEGVWRDAKTADEKLAVEELMHAQSLMALYSVVGKMEKAGLQSEEATQAVAHHILDRAASLQKCRWEMALKGVQPKNLKV